MKVLRQMNTKYRAGTKYETTLSIEKFLTFVELELKSK